MNGDRDHQRIADEGRAALERMDDDCLTAAALLAASTLRVLRFANPDAVAALLVELAKRLEGR